MKWLLLGTMLAGAFLFSLRGLNADVTSCQDDGDCRVFAIKDCCGFTTQTCYSRTASEDTINNLQVRHCQIAKYNCSIKPAPASYCRCGEGKKCETVREGQ